VETEPLKEDFPTVDFESKKSSKSSKRLLPLCAVFCFEGAVGGDDVATDPVAAEVEVSCFFEVVLGREGREFCERGGRGFANEGRPDEEDIEGDEGASLVLVGCCDWLLRLADSFGGSSIGVSVGSSSTEEFLARLSCWK